MDDVVFIVAFDLFVISLLFLIVSSSHFSPRSIELFAQSFLALAKSIELVDLRQNEIGLRGGWAIVDALKKRDEKENFSPLCEIRIECDQTVDHDTIHSMKRGHLPTPNIEQITSAQRIKPAYFERLQQILKENRIRRDMKVLKQDNEKKTSKSAESLPTDSTHPDLSAAAIISSTTPSTSAFQHTPMPSSSDFITSASYHASLGRLISELNHERQLRQLREKELAESNQRETELRQQLKEKSSELDLAHRRYTDLEHLLSSEVARANELDHSLREAHKRESALITSHLRQIGGLTKEVREERNENERVRSELRKVSDAREEERIQWTKELRNNLAVHQQQLAAARNEREVRLSQIEQRMESLKSTRHIPPNSTLSLSSARDPALQSPTASSAPTTTIITIQSSTPPPPSLSSTLSTQSPSPISTQSTASSLPSQSQFQAQGQERRLVLKPRQQY